MKTPFRSLRSALLFLIVLIPAFLLHSFVMVLRSELGVLDGRTILAALRVLVLPIAAGWWIASGCEDLVRRRLAGALLALGSAALTLLGLEAALRVMAPDDAAGSVWRKLLGE